MIDSLYGESTSKKREKVKHYITLLRIDYKITSMHKESNKESWTSTISEVMILNNSKIHKFEAY